MERLAVLSVYCPDAEALVRELPGSATDRFPNLEVIETAEELPYFDAREEEGFRWASSCSSVPRADDRRQARRRDRGSGQGTDTSQLERAVNSIGGLRTALLDLLQRLEGSDVRLIIGGGFGILLKIEHVQKIGGKNASERLAGTEIHERHRSFSPPGTADQLLQGEAARRCHIRSRLQSGRGGREVSVRQTGSDWRAGRSLKLDILTGPRSSFAGTGLCTDERRVRPNPSVGLHAHPVDEVPTLEENLLTVSVAGKLSSGEIREDEVLLPHPFSFLTMKLFALHDRLDDKEKDFARYHALDITPSRLRQPKTSGSRPWRCGIDIAIIRL